MGNRSRHARRLENLDPTVRTAVALDDLNMKQKPPRILKRTAAADPIAVLADLHLCADYRHVLALAETRAVQNARRIGMSWAAIGEALDRPQSTLYRLYG